MQLFRSLRTSLFLKCGFEQACFHSQADRIPNDTIRNTKRPKPNQQSVLFTIANWKQASLPNTNFRIKEQVGRTPWTGGEEEVGGEEWSVIIIVILDISVYSQQCYLCSIVSFPALTCNMKHSISSDGDSHCTCMTVCRGMWCISNSFGGSTELYINI